ncbi:MAG TPA: hypothetical protein VJY15_13310 [Candidatus Acidoferrum sp.]|nr:hypothetical protein [Candidatus Acidoferrum sp.]
MAKTLHHAIPPPGMSKKPTIGRVQEVARRPPKTSMEILAHRHARINPMPVATPQRDIGSMTIEEPCMTWPISPIGGLLAKSERLTNSVNPLKAITDKPMSPISLTHFA